MAPTEASFGARNCSSSVAETAEKSREDEESDKEEGADDDDDDEDEDGRGRGWGNMGRGIAEANRPTLCEGGRMWDTVSCLACPAHVRELLSRQGTVVLPGGSVVKGMAEHGSCGTAAAGHSPWASIWHRCHMGLRMTKMATGCSAQRSLEVPGKVRRGRRGGKGKRWKRETHRGSVRTEGGCTSHRRTGTYARIRHARAPGPFLRQSLVSRVSSSLAQHESSSLLCLLLFVVPGECGF